MQVYLLAYQIEVVQYTCKYTSAGVQYIASGAEKATAIC